MTTPTTFPPPPIRAAPRSPLAAARAGDQARLGARGEHAARARRRLRALRAQHGGVAHVRSNDGEHSNPDPHCAVNTRSLTTRASRTCHLAITQVSTFAVNYKGKPYMEGLSANKGLLITLGAIDIVRWDGGKAGGGKIRVRDRAMHLIPHPHTLQPGP